MIEWLLMANVTPVIIEMTAESGAVMLAEGETPPPKPRRVKPKAPVPVEKTEAPATPEAPIPYSALNAPATETKPVTPSAAPTTPLPPLKPDPSPIDAPAQTPAPTTDRLPDPPPPPERVYTSPLDSASTAREVSLRCDTLVFTSDKVSTRGIVRLSLIPSAVNPDEYADIHVMAVDIGHASIIRNTVCEAYRCPVSVTPTFYALTVVDRKKSEIKITLNRQTGAFYGYEKQPETMASGLITLRKNKVVSENGWCVPEVRGKTLF